MRATVHQPAAGANVDRVLPALIMVGAAVNGLLVRVVEDAGAGSLTLGLSPFQIVTLFVAASLSLTRGSDAVPRPRIASALDIAALMLILVPNSAVSWLALALYAAAHVAFQTDERRQGAMLFLALALTALWSSVILRWLAAPVTAAEAILVGQLLAPFRPDIVQTANVIGNPETHSLILMTRCTTTDALPAAIVALSASPFCSANLMRGVLAWHPRYSALACSPPTSSA